MTWMRGYKQKMLISKISIDSNFTFSSYAWLCMFQCSHRLLCWIKSCRQDFLWELLSYHTKLFQPNSFWGNVLLRGELQKDARNLNFENWESALYSKSGNMPLNFDSTEFLKKRKSAEKRWLHTPDFIRAMRNNFGKKTWKCEKSNTNKLLKIMKCPKTG